MTTTVLYDSPGYNVSRDEESDLVFIANRTQDTDGCAPSADMPELVGALKALERVARRSSFDDFEPLIEPVEEFIEKYLRKFLIRTGSDDDAEGN